MTNTQDTAYPAGSLVRARIVFEPEDDSTVDLADVTCTYITQRGDTGEFTSTTPTPDDAAMYGQIVAGVDPNTFEIDISTPDTIESTYVLLRWKSNPPSADIVLERMHEPNSTRFWLEGSLLPTP